MLLVQAMGKMGVDLNLNSLLVFCALFGFGGSLISLLLSKWMAKRGTGTHIIEQPQNPDEQWLVDTVKELASEAGIGMPEVGIFPSEAANAFATGWNRNDALVAVSAGLLRRFQSNEVRAVLAHEIGHVTARHAVRQDAAQKGAKVGTTAASILSWLATGNTVLGNVTGPVSYTHLTLPTKA